MDLRAVISNFNSSYTLFIPKHSRKEIATIIPSSQCNIEAHATEMTEDFLFLKKYSITVDFSK